MPKRPKGTMSNTIRLGLFWAILILSTLAVWALAMPHTTLKDVPISEVISEANAGKLSKIQGEGNSLTTTEKGKDKPTEKSYIQGGVSALLKDNLLNDTGKKIVSDSAPSETGTAFWNIVLS